MDNGLLQEPPKWMTSANALSPCPLTLPCRLSRDRAVVGPERREELSELGEEGGAGLQNILSPPSPRFWDRYLCGDGKAFHTRSALKVRNKGVFLSPVLGWEVT